MWSTVWGAGGPWTRADVRTALSTTAVGLLIFAWAWWEASGSADVDHQTGWLVVGVLGVIVVVKGMVSWLRTGWRQVRLRRLRIIDASDDVGVNDPRVDESSRAGEAHAAGRFAVVSGSTRYHRVDCLLVRGKAWRLQTGAAVKRLRPCEMCDPGETPRR